MGRTVSALLTIAVTTAGVGFSTASLAVAGEPVVKRLDRAIKDLPVARETPNGYDRDLFRLWIDADRDCQDTRDEVLAAEALVKVSGCDIQGGKWISYYDGVSTRSSREFDIDHVVPLAEAWHSGAKRWNAATRERYANDLRDPRSLVAVSASSNRSKSDRDPAEWMPQRGTCTYVRQWVAVKIRWHLKVDRSEKRALTSLTAGCKNSTIRVTRAVVRLREATDSNEDGGLDPRFEYCYQATAAGFGPYYDGKDPEYSWYTDGDGDGVACE